MIILKQFTGRKTGAIYTQWLCDSCNRDLAMGHYEQPKCCMFCCTQHEHNTSRVSV